MTSVEKLSGIRLKNYLEFRKNPLVFLSETRNIADFVELGASSFVVHHPGAMKEILVSKASSFEKGSSASILSKTIGRGILTSEGETHNRQRKMTMPAFHKEKLAGYMKVIQSETLKLIDSWKGGETLCVSNEMMKLTLCIILKTMFGKDISEPESDELAQAVSDIIEKSAGDLFLPFPVPGFIPTPRNHRYHAGKEKLLALTDELIAHTPKGDHLLHLLQTTTLSNGSPLSKEEIRSQILTMLIAGHETTANVLSWMWYELASQPEVEERLVEEWHNTKEGVKNQTMTGQFLKETLRLYPAAWVLLREAPEPVYLKGHYFKKGASFLLSPYLMHRNPAFFKNPDVFDVNRFSTENAKKLTSFAYLPFGTGPRSCIGSQFAMNEAQLIFSLIGRAVHFEMLENHHPIQAEPLVSLRIQNGLYMRMHKR
ncbi:cytochrome P450 [Pseudalkalibacillus hwajinpoensis]|uniref:cytochrome P450 n=1 Tax=Guptibacillus hwajinpoensis TaxID=208199 RepID=UPI00325BA54F